MRRPIRSSGCPLAVTALVLAAAVIPALAEKGTSAKAAAEPVAREVIAVASSDECEPSKDCLEKVQVIRLHPDRDCADGSKDCKRTEIYEHFLDPDRLVEIGSGNQPFIWSGRHGYLGVHLMPLNRELLRHFGVAHDVGVMISKVEPDSPAEQSGLKVGDIITAVDGKPLATDFAVARAIAAKADGDVVDLEVWRDRRVQTLSATVAVRERARFDFGVLMAPGDDERELTFHFDPTAFAAAEARLREALRSADHAGAASELAAAAQERAQVEMQEKLRVMEEKLLEMQRRLEAALAEGRKAR